MADEDDHEAHMEALEAEIGHDGDDPFLSIDACMDSKEFLTKLAANKDTLIALFPDTPLTDDECKTFVSKMASATRLEGISIEGAQVSPTGVALIIASCKKHGKIRHLNVGSQNFTNEKVAKILADFVQATTTLETLNVSLCEFQQAGVKLLLDALQNNTSLHSVIATIEDDATAKHIDAITSRNRAARERPKSPTSKAGSPTGVQQKTTASSSAQPALSSSSHGGTIASSFQLAASKSITIWFKGPVHFGETPPAESGWTRFTFDAGIIPAQGPPASKPTQTVPELAQTASTPVKQAPTSASSNQRGSAPAPPGVAPPAAVVRDTSPPPPAYAQAATTAKTMPTSLPISVAAPRPPAGAAPPAKSAPKILFKCQALYTYKASEAGEASFKKGDTVSIMNADDEDWWEAVVESTGAKGQVPSNHLKKM